MLSFENFMLERQSTIDLNDPLFEEHVEAVNEHLSSLGHEYFVDQAANAKSYAGLQYVRVGGGKDQSQQAALVMPGTFANGVWPHIVARAEALSFQAANAGMRDDKGDLLPVLVTAAPSMRSNFGLDKQELRSVRHGDMGAVAARHTTLAHMIGIEYIPGAVGMSQGSTIVGPIMERAGQEFAQTDLHAVLVEIPNSKRRAVMPVPRLLSNFVREGSTFNHHLSDEAIEVIDDLFAQKQAADKFEKGIVKEGRENLAIVKGFARGKLARDLSSLVLTGVKTTVVYGSESLVARGKDVRAAIAQAEDELETFGVSRQNIEQNLYVLEIGRATHSFGDRVGRFATVAAAGLTR